MIISTKNAPAAIGPYSQAIKSGNMIFTSGQIGINPQTGNIEGKNAAQQIKQAIENLKAILTEGGVELSDVVKTTVFIKDMNDFGEINSVYESYFSENPPARSCVEVARLPKDALVEIEAVAIK